MKVFVSFDGDHIGRMVGRASLADKPEEVSRIAQAIDRGNAIWRSWAESHGGQVINIGGDEGRLCVEADHLQELPKIRDQYSEAVGSTVSVGVGTKLSEADKSLMAAKLQGGDRIQLYTEEVNEVLEELRDNSEAAKLYDEYLDPESAIQKAQPGMNQGEHGGFSGASRSQPAAPQQEGSEHSEAEAARATYGVEEPQPGAPATDYESLFHQAAQQAPQDEPQRPSGLQDDVRAQVVKILQDVRGKAQALEEMRQTNPDMYNSIKGLVEAMITMARGLDGQEQQQPVQKAEGKVGRCKWKLGERRCQRMVTGDYCHDHDGHWANKIEKRKEAEVDLAKGDVVNLNPPAPTGKKFRAKAKVEDARADFNQRRQEANAARELPQKPIVQSIASADPHKNIPGTRDIYDYSSHLTPEQQSAGYNLHIHSAPKGAPDSAGMIAQLSHNGTILHDAWALPQWQGGAGNFHVSSYPGHEQHGTVGLFSPAFKTALDAHSAVLLRDRGQQFLDQQQAEADAPEPEPQAPAPKPRPAHLQVVKEEVEKAALEAGKTGRHQVVLPVGSQIDPGPSAAHEGGEIKVRDPETGKTKWRQVRSGLVMAPDGTPTSSRNPGG